MINAVDYPADGIPIMRPKRCGGTPGTPLFGDNPWSGVNVCSPTVPQMFQFETRCILRNMAKKVLFYFALLILR